MASRAPTSSISERDIAFFCRINRARALTYTTLRCSFYGILRSALNGEEEHRHINYDQGKNRFIKLPPRAKRFAVSPRS